MNESLIILILLITMINHATIGDVFKELKNILTSQKLSSNKYVFKTTAEADYPYISIRIAVVYWRKQYKKLNQKATKVCIPVKESDIVAFFCLKQEKNNRDKASCFQNLSKIKEI